VNVFGHGVAGFMTGCRINCDTRPSADAYRMPSTAIPAGLAVNLNGNGYLRMSLRFEELDWQPTSMGDISLRRRFDPFVKADVYEVKLGEEFLMSSLFTAAEIALARLGLAELSGDRIDVVVGGLGLGHTARTALEDQRVASCTIVEALRPVIDWHRRELVPDAGALVRDQRTRFVHGDFFALNETGFDPERPGRRYDAILLDIDHSPSHLLNPSHAGFYTPDGLRQLGRQLQPGGVFALWSNDPPDSDFIEILTAVFTSVRAEVVGFPNPLQGNTATNTVYIAT
jgi:spermidine synthase